MIKFCSKCKEEHRDKCPTGYSYWWNDYVENCRYDNNKFINIDFPAKDLKILLDVSEDSTFVEAMIQLRNENIIEYETRMSQFKSQVEHQEQVEENNKPHCPHCHSTSISKIGAGERIGSVAMLGIFSKKINKSFKCKNCGYTW